MLHSVCGSAHVYKTAASIMSLCSSVDSFGLILAFLLKSARPSLLQRCHSVAGVVPLCLGSVE